MLWSTYPMRMTQKRSLRMRFGKLDLPEDDLPTPRELHNAISDTWTVRDQRQMVEGEPPVDLEEKGSNSVLIEQEYDHNFCNFIYTADKEDVSLLRKDDEVEIAPDNNPVRSFVFYFGNGQFAYESVEGLIDDWIPQFICDRTSINTADQYTLNEFSQSTMSDFFHKMDKITAFRFGSVEDSSQISSQIGRALDQLADEVGSQEFTGGQPPSDLSDLQIFNEAIDATSVKKIRGERDGSYTKTILQSGMYEVVWDDEGIGSQRERAVKVYTEILPYLNILS